MTKLAIFGNVFIDNTERLIRMCDSLSSIPKDQVSNWIINIRGSKFNDAAQQIREILQGCCNAHRYLLRCVYGTRR